MSETPKYPDSVTADPVFQQTYEALVAFTGEDNVSLEQVPLELLKTLCAGKAFDGVTFAAALCLPHFRDYADVTDHGDDIPKPVRDVLLAYHDLGQTSATMAEMVERICADNRDIAQLRLAEYVVMARDKRSPIVNENDQEEFFHTCVMTTAILQKISRARMWEFMSPDMLQVVIDEARLAETEMITLDTDLFTDLPASAKKLLDAIDALDPHVRSAKFERDLAIAAAEATARARAERPQDFVFPHPESAYERLKNGASKRFKL